MAESRACFVVEDFTALAVDVIVTDELLSVELADGRVVAAPLSWFPRLSHATPAERETWRLIARGRGIHWPDIDEDISVAGLIAGKPSREGRTSLKKWLAGRRKSMERRKQ